MDAIVSQLNKVAQEKLKNTSPMPKESGAGSSGVQKTFDQTMADRMLEKIQNDGIDKSEVNAISAQDIHVETMNPEIAASSKPASGSEKYFDMFKGMNRDLVSLDAAIETLTTPGVKITPRQMLALQAGIANTSIMAEGFSRFTDAVAKGIQTVVQTQV